MKTNPGSQTPIVLPSTKLQQRVTLKIVNGFWMARRPKGPLRPGVALWGSRCGPRRRRGGAGCCEKCDGVDGNMARMKVSSFFGHAEVQSISAAPRAKVRAGRYACVARLWQVY